MKNPLFKTILRAIVKSFPIGNAISEAVRNWKAQKTLNTGEINKDVLLKLSPDETKDLGNAKETTPHDWLSIAIQVLFTACILYAFFTKQITAEKLIELFNQIKNLI